MSIWNIDNDVAPYNVSLAWYGPPKFSCFLKLHPAAPIQEQNNNQHHMHMHEGFIEPSTLLPRSINTTELGKWSPEKASKIFWFITGANVTDGSENLLNTSTIEHGYDGRPKYLGLNVGWGGLATASLNEGYQNLVKKHLANFIAYPATSINVKEDISTYFFKSAGAAIKNLLNNSFPQGANLLYSEVSTSIKAVFDAYTLDNFKTKFHEATFPDVPPTGAVNTARINHNLLNSQTQEWPDDNHNQI